MRSILVAKTAIQDSTDKGRFLLELYRKTQTHYDKELYNYFLDHAINVTESKIGFFHIVSSDQKTINLTIWNREVLKNCKANYASHYPIEQAGNWVDCVRLKKSVIYNNFPDSPNQKGLPEGHIPVTRMLSIPILEEGQVSAIFGVGNKNEPYVEEDVVQLEVIASELQKIIKQRRAEAELLESKEKYYLLFANMLNGFVYCRMLFDKEGKPHDFICLEVNQAFEEILDTKRDDLVGKKASELMQLKNLEPQFLDKIGKVALEGAKEKIETFIKPLNLWLAMSIYSPKKGYFAAVFENVTERKKAEEALKESGERLRQSQEIAHVGSWIYDAAKDRLSWTEEVYRIFGLRPEEFDGTFDGFLRSVPEEERKVVRELFYESLDSAAGSEIEHRVIRKSTGEIRIVHEECQHIRDEAGKIVRSVGMVQDITEQKKSEQALLESEERLRFKLDSLLSPDVEIDEQELANIIDAPALQATMNHLYSVTNMGFALIDLKGNILVKTGFQEICSKFHRVNSLTCRNCIESDLELSSGVKRGDIRLYKCKNNMLDVVTPLYIGDKHVGNLFFGQFFFDDEVLDRNLFEQQADKYGFDKKEYMAAFERIPRYNKKNMQNLMIFYSRLSEMISRISLANLKLTKSLENQKQLQTELEEKAVEVEEYANQMEQLAEKRAKQLKDAERLSAIGATAGMVGHDIRNPLQAITNHLYLTRRKAEQVTDNEIKQGIVKNVQNIEENLRYINKIVADLQDFAAPLNPKKEHLKVEEAIQDALTMVAVPENVAVNIDTPDSLPSLYADYTMLKRILVNLMQNSVQAMPSGGHLNVSAAKKGADMEFVVEDTGEGIPRDVQAKIFTPLITTKPKGQGFGLAVVKRMTEAMGGTITFETEPDKGTKFSVKFPI
jgi:PAS domain S-box-containing protein